MMIIDLSPSLETAIIQKAQRNGMAIGDYIANVLQQDLQKTANPHDNEQMTAFYYDRKRMDEALQAPRVTVPHFDTPEELMTWMDSLTDADFTEQV